MTNEPSDGVARLINKVRATGVGKGAQSVLAEDLNVSEAFISKCMKRRWFPVPRAKELATLYNMEPMDLIKPSLRAEFADMTSRS
jgi:hypothetical protein